MILYKGMLKHVGIVLQQRWQQLRYGVVQLGRRVTFMGDHRFLRPNLLVLGDDVFLGKHTEFFIHQDGSLPRIFIGKRTWVGASSTLSAHEEIRVGESVILSPNVHIADHTHHYEDIDVPVMDQGVTTPRPVSIGDGSWIGRNVLIGAGVQIGKHCIIGANSVVKNSVPDFTMVAGAPAKVLKRYDSKKKTWLRV